MKIAVVGLGLIGGSLALAARKSKFATHIIGVDKNVSHAARALELSLVEEILKLDIAIEYADVIILATPVQTLLHLVPYILDKLLPHQTLIDVGSTKSTLVQAIKNHKHRAQFVAAHPMAGTEFSGPEAAIQDLFAHKVCVICNKEESSAHALKVCQEFFAAIKMQLLYMDAEAHDVHTAYISHISHLSSFALALTVLEKEQDEEKIFDLASGGFRSTVRLAKSNPDTWLPIFEQNRDNLLDVLDEHIHVLSIMRSCLIKKKFGELNDMMVRANDINRILK